MKQTQKLLLVVLLGLALVSSQKPSTFTVTIEQTEKQLKDLANAASSKFSRRCSDSTCPNKTLDECSTVLPPVECHKDVPYPVECSGIELNYSKNAGRCATTEPCSTEQDKSLICSMGDLFSTDLMHNKDEIYVNQYVGFRNSFRVIYPYVHNGFQDDQKCVDYDPRYRPWYVAAATGAKNIVLILDTSGSMNTSERMNHLKTAASAVIQTLGSQDWFGIVVFNKDATTYKSTLIQATQINRETAIKFVEGLSEGGLTNYEKAFLAAKQMIKQTTASEFGSNCGQTMVLFLTDGIPTVADDAGHKVSDTYNDKSSADQKAELQSISTKFVSYLKSTVFTEAKKPIIFTYGLGVNNEESTIVQGIACGFQGIYYSIADSAGGVSPLITKMRSYYDYLTLGLDFNQPIWSEIYKDSTTGKEFITASMPIFVKNDQNVNILLGVAGVDIDHATVKQFGDFSTKYSEVSTRLRTQCAKKDVSFTSCQLDSLRGKEFECNSGQSCPEFEVGYKDCNANISGSVWAVKGDDSTYYEKSKNQITACCGDKGSASLMMFSLGMLLAVVMLLA